MKFQPTTIAEVEARQGDINHSREEWQDLKSAMQPGDELVAFQTELETWQSLCGRADYALVRKGKVVRELITIMN